MATLEHHAPVLPKPEELKAPWIVAQMRTRWGIVGALAGLAALIAFFVARGSGDPLAVSHFFRA